MSNCTFEDIFFFVVVKSVFSSSYITPCKADDEPCMLASAQAALPHLAAGVPELGVPQADPLVIKDIQAEINNLKLGFADMNIVGPGKAKFLKLIHDTSKRMITLKFEFPLFINGHYDMQGKVLFLNAAGNGPFKFYTDKIAVTIELKYKDIEKSGQKYWKITGFEYSYDLVKKVYMKLENLFGGNKEAAEPVNRIFDEYWKEVILDLGGPIIERIITEYVNIIKKFLLAIPVDKLVIN